MAYLKENKWTVVVGSFLGLLVGNGPIMLFSFGLFIKPVADGLGVGRGTVSTALTVGLVTTGIATPALGWAVDRYGIRKVVVPTIVLFGGSMAAIGTAGSAVSLTLFYALAGVLAASQTPVTYAKAIASTFDRRRGLALGMAIAGVGLGAAIVPKFAELLVDNLGWRGAYMGLGAATIVIAAPSMFWLVGAGHLKRRALESEAPALSGFTAREALRKAVFWKLAFTIFAVSCLTNGAVAHLIPLLTDRGVELDHATSILSSIGLALIGGRILAGYLLDVFHAPFVAAFFFAMPVMGVALLLFEGSAALALPAVLLIGVGVGSEMDVIAYLQSRYLGLKAFGQLYGYLFAIFMFGSGLGPLAVGMSYQALESYAFALSGLSAVLLVACVTILSLESYRRAPASP